MNLQQKYFTIVDALCQEFIMKYFTYWEWDYADYYIIGDLNVWLWPVHISDYYRSIDIIITALENNIPKDMLLDWYDKQLENKQPINLYNYYLNNAKL